MVDFLFSVINLIIKALGAVLGLLISVLPNSPFQGILDSSTVTDFLGGLAWIIPFPSIIAVFGAWGTCIALYYIYSIALRWIKAVK